MKVVDALRGEDHTTTVLSVNDVNANSSIVTGSLWAIVAGCDVSPRDPVF